MNLYIKVGRHPHCRRFLNLDSISLLQPRSSLSATLQFLSVPLKDQGLEANAVFHTYESLLEEATAHTSVATESLHVPSNGKLSSKLLKRM